MKRLSAVFIFLIPGILFAQTNAEKLESAVKMYNSTRDFEDDLKPGDVTMDDIYKMKADRAAADALLDDVKTNGSAEEVKVARYFAANYQYEIGFVYGMMGKNREAYDVLSNIKGEFEYFGNSYNFPLNYQFNAQNYSITYDNFAPTLAEYYTGMAEICANLGKAEESMEWSRKTLGFSYTTDWYKYIALNKLIELKQKNGEWDKEMLDCSLQQITLYAQLDTSYRRTIKENKYPTSEFGADHIRQTLEKKPELAKDEYYRGTAAPLLAETRQYDLALEFYRAALAGGFADYNKEYLYAAADFAMDEDNNSIALLALNLVYDKNTASFSCDEWDKLANLFGKAGSPEKKNSCQQKSEECRKKEKRIEKQNRSGSLGFGFYVGTYPLALATRFNRYRDYGAVAGIIVGKVALEGSYKLINRNFVITDDLYFKHIKQDNPYYWEGSRIHLNLKFYPKGYSEERFYLGPLFEMVSRTYEPVYSDVSNTSTNTVYATQKEFHPTEKSYNLFFNYGQQLIKKGFYYDMFMGFGVAYNKFQVDDDYYGDSQYTFSDVLLQNRKPTRISPMIRLGMTIGFGWLKH